MKKRVFCLLILVGLPTSAICQAGHIGVFADPLATDCHPRDIFPQVLQVHVVQILADAAAAEFTVSTGGGFDGSFLGEQVANDHMIQVGNSDAGTAIAFGGCSTAPVHILTLNFYCQGLSVPCSYFEITSNSNGELQYVDCDDDLADATGGRTYVNPDGSCECEAPGFATPVEETTWGGVKATFAQ